MAVAGEELLTEEGERPRKNAPLHRLLYPRKGGYQLLRGLPPIQLRLGLDPRNRPVSASFHRKSSFAPFVMM